MEMEKLVCAMTLHCSQDGGDSFTAITGVTICKKCGKRTIVCPHRRPQEEVLELPSETTHVKIIPVEPDMRITLSSERNVRMIKLVENVKFSLLETLTTLEEVWEDIGIKDDQKEQRNNTVSTHLQALLNEMLAEECDLKAKMEVRTEEYKRELEQLCNDLQLPPKQIPSDTTLVQLEIKLRNDVDTLNKEKHDRLKCLRRLRAEEQLLCEQLVMPQHEINFVGSPTLTQLRELEQNVVYLKSEKNKRSATFEILKGQIISLWTKMDIKPENDFEKKLFVDDTTFTLSAKNLENLNVINTKLEVDHVELLQQIEEKRDKFKLLWGRLEQQLDEKEKVEFSLIPTGNTANTLAILNKNIEHIQALKKQHLQKFIEAIRNELVVLWDKCYFGENQRKTFEPYCNNVYTEEALIEYEHQFNSVKSYYEDNKELFKLVGKRETLWEEKLKLESSPEDNLRFNNRGGALLKALRNKQHIDKQLPKIEKQLNNKIKTWECENESMFMYKDCRYMDYIESQKQDYECEQQVKKNEKQRVKKQELSNEIVYGSSSTKRKFATPTMVSSKCSRIDSSSKKSKQSSNNRTTYKNDSKVGDINETRNIYRSPMPKRLRQQHTGNKKSFISKDKTPSKNSKFTHSSLCSIPPSPQKNVQNENTAKGVKKKTIISKLTTESRKKTMKRRSIISNRILKDKNIDNVEVEIIQVMKSSDDKVDENISLISYKDFSNGVAEVPFSRSSFVFKPEPDGPDMSVVNPLY